jgi:O-succinylhomoserine sulfhydrylase
MQDGRCYGWFCFASGMAAVYSTMAALLSGDHIISSSSVLGNTFVVCELFPKWNISNFLF